MFSGFGPTCGQSDSETHIRNLWTLEGRNPARCRHILVLLQASSTDYPLRFSFVDVVVEGG